LQKFFSMLDNLVPVSKQHSIGRVAATVHLAQSVLKVDKVFNKLNEDPKIAFKYPRRNISYLQSINLSANPQIVNMPTNNKVMNGFLFENFDAAGRLKGIFRLLNKDNKASITYETRIYVNWSTFYNEFLEEVKNFASAYPFYISAISLNYVDDFTWTSKEKIPVKEIFNPFTTLLNSKFLESDNSNLSFLIQNDQNSENIEEKIDVTFSNKVKKIVINHQYAKQIDNLEYSEEIFEKGNFGKYFDIAHDANKEILRDILSVDVQKKIGLTQK
jgi:uncharacterized protein (TIGR04255 family)